ncbi:hypothetical protein [Herbiconiux daphne]|uniref:Uncharacterized protein n=1 Tax=Herbiconiux daphne TaxID=2970914 RepID=A0ABT2H9M9_9MICO|nr:hypothetical protein [Herbiconiux daphne]MCS5736634.1 hypothetical protein [Herbiconiux daphne]
MEKTKLELFKELIAELTENKKAYEAIKEPALQAYEAIKEPASQAYKAIKEPA